MAAAPPTDFADVYDEHVWRVYGFLAYRLPSRTDAEDLTQLTFERALRAWGRYDPSRASVSTWLLTIARNLLIDHRRADRSALCEPLPDIHGERFSAAPDRLDLGLDSALADSLSRLSTAGREIIALRFGGDLSGREISALTGLSLANVQQILSRSLRQLRSELESGEPEPLSLGAGAPPAMRRGPL